MFVEELLQGEEKGGVWGGSWVQVEWFLPITGKRGILEFFEDSLDSEGTSIVQIDRISTESCHTHLSEKQTAGRIGQRNLRLGHDHRPSTI